MTKLIALITTICLAQGHEAECKREVRLFQTAEECEGLKLPTRDYLSTMETPPGVEVVFVAAACEIAEGV